MSNIEESSHFAEPMPTPSRLIDRMGTGCFQIWLFIAFSLHSLMFAILASIAGFILFIVDQNWSTSTLQVALFSSLLILAMACGSYLSIALEPRFGRWKLVLYGQAATIVLSIASTFVPEFYSLLATRILIVVSLYIAANPAYSSMPEMVPSQYRGSFVSVCELIGGAARCDA